MARLLNSVYLTTEGISTMQQSSAQAREIDAEMCTGLGSVQLVRELFTAPIDVFGKGNEHRLGLTLLPRSNNQKGCFPDLWGPHRFEPIGQIYLFPANHRVHCKSDCRRQESIVCNFEPTAVATWFDGELKWTHGRLQSSLDIVSPNIRSLLFRIGEEMRSPGFGSETMVELMTAQVAIELSRHLTGIEDNKTIGGLSSRHLRLIDERLNAGGPPPTLVELASLCNLSVRHVTRAFRASRGRSIGSYVAEHRTDHAKRLLAAGMSVKAVAYTTGFSCPSNFTTAFHRATGQTPREFRQRASSSGMTLPTPIKTH
jgi:AraC family transcriptional regulator